MMFVTAEVCGHRSLFKTKTSRLNEAQVFFHQKKDSLINIQNEMKKEKFFVDDDPLVTI